MLPTYYLSDDLRASRLVQLLPDHEPDVLGIHAIYRSSQHQALALRLLVDFPATLCRGPDTMGCGARGPSPPTPLQAFRLC